MAPLYTILVNTCPACQPGYELARYAEPTRLEPIPDQSTLIFSSLDGIGPIALDEKFPYRPYTLPYSFHHFGTLYPPDLFFPDPKAGSRVLALFLPRIAKSIRHECFPSNCPFPRQELLTIFPDGGSCWFAVIRVPTFMRRDQDGREHEGR